MGQIFLGKWWHWGIIIILGAVMWWAGTERMHVIRFNPFLFLLLAVTTAAILVLLTGSSPGEQVTRDRLADDESDSSRHDGA